MGGVRVSGRWAVVWALVLVLAGGLFVRVDAGIFDSWGRGGRLERNVASFEDAGKQWGERLREARIKPGSLNSDFVQELINPERIDFFNVHSELKEAFKKGFRLGFEDRIADLVLGPHLTEAAGQIGFNTSGRFVNVIETFEKGWAETLRNAVEVFIVLISEGSQADRELFIDRFTRVYTDKFDATQRILKSRGYMTQVSEGGTLLFLDYSKGKTLGALDIPAPEALKGEIYQQTFKVMGDEWGRRFSTNLIKRDELIDLLRRAKTALQETPKAEPSLEARLQRNLGIIYTAFRESYGTDADNVFQSLVRDAGYTMRATPSALPGAEVEKKLSVSPSAGEVVRPAAGGKKRR